MRNIILFSSVYLLWALDSSFFVHFAIFDFFPPIAFLGAAIILLAEKYEKNTGLAVFALTGLLYDSQSNFFFGFWTLSFLTAAFIIKLCLRHYVRIPGFKGF